MHSATRILTVIILALAGQPAIAQQTTEQSIIETLQAMWAALEAGDVDKYAKYVHPDYTLFGESDIYLFEGKSLETRNMADWVARAKGVHTEMHDPKVTVRGDVAWMTYYWTDAGYVAGERYTSQGKSTRVFVRENNQWLCIHGHFTAVP